MLCRRRETAVRKDDRTANEVGTKKRSTKATAPYIGKIRKGQACTGNNTV